MVPAKMRLFLFTLFTVYGVQCEKTKVVLRVLSSRSSVKGNSISTNAAPVPVVPEEQKLSTTERQYESAAAEDVPYYPDTYGYDSPGWNNYPSPDYGYPSYYYGKEDYASPAPDPDPYWNSYHPNEIPVIAMDPPVYYYDGPPKKKKKQRRINLIKRLQSSTKRRIQAALRELGIPSSSTTPPPTTTTTSAPQVREIPPTLSPPPPPPIMDRETASDSNPVVSLARQIAPTINGLIGTVGHRLTREGSLLYLQRQAILANYNLGKAVVVGVPEQVIMTFLNLPTTVVNGGKTLVRVVSALTSPPPDPMTRSVPVMMQFTPMPMTDEAAAAFMSQGNELGMRPQSLERPIMDMKDFNSQYDAMMGMQGYSSSPQMPLVRMPGQNGKTQPEMSFVPMMQNITEIQRGGRMIDNVSIAYGSKIMGKSQQQDSQSSGTMSQYQLRGTNANAWSPNPYFYYYNDLTYPNSKRMKRAGQKRQG